MKATGVHTDSIQQAGLICLSAVMLYRKVVALFPSVQKQRIYDDPLFSPKYLEMSIMWALVPHIV
jgi:hypothetical protein